MITTSGKHTLIHIISPSTSQGKNKK